MTTTEPTPPTAVDLTALAGILGPDGTVHIEATIGASLTACGKYADSNTEIVAPDGLSCRDCADALVFAAKATGRPDDLRVAAGGLLIAADRLDPTGGTLSTEEDE